MKKIFAAFMALILAVMLSGCANDVSVNGKTYPAFGIVNDDAQRDPNVKYQISFGSVVVAVLFLETIVVPIYVIGWDLWEPVKMIDGSPLR